MMGFSRKRADELLVTHPPERIRNRLGREAAAAAAARLPADVARVAAALTAAADPEQRSHLLVAIQERFGNAFAERVVRAAQGTDGDGPAAGNDTGEPPQ